MTNIEKRLANTEIALIALSILVTQYSCSETDVAVQKLFEDYFEAQEGLGVKHLGIQFHRE